MKIRNGFVSNSSSASFVLGKCYMTDEQIEKFSRYVNYLDDYISERCSYEEIPDDLQSFIDVGPGSYEPGNPDESDLYFFGDVDYSITGELCEYLKSIGVDEKYYILRG